MRPEMLECPEEQLKEYVIGREPEILFIESELSRLNSFDEMR
jgi:hypothetical protein